MTSRGSTFGRVDAYTPSAQSAPKSGASVPERARTDEPMVYVVDDETSIRNSTKELAESVGLRVQTFATAQRRPDVGEGDEGRSDRLFGEAISPPGFSRRDGPRNRT